MTSVVKIISVLFSVLYLAQAARVNDLPSYFPRCKRNDPKINECLLKATKTVKPYIINGVPELGIPPFDPFFVPEIRLAQGTQALNFKALLKNVTIMGLGTYEFSQFDFDVPNLRWFCKGIIKKIELKGDFSVDGKILLAPIVGSGKFEAGIDYSTLSVIQNVELVKRNGEDYAKPLFANTTISIGGPQVHLNFEGDNTNLNNVTNAIINDNVNELFDDLKPAIEEIVSKLAEQALLNNIENKIPFDKLYPLE